MDNALTPHIDTDNSPALDGAQRATSLMIPLENVERVIVIAVSSYSRYGMATLYIHLMRDDSGNLLVWKTTSRPLEEGVRYTGKATVKEHTVYRDEKQTILTRCDFERAE